MCLPVFPHFVFVIQVSCGYLWGVCDSEVCGLEAFRVLFEVVQGTFVGFDEDVVGKERISAPFLKCEEGGGAGGVGGVVGGGVDGYAAGDEEVGVGAC